MIGYPLAYFLARSTSRWRHWLTLLVIFPPFTGIVEIDETIYGRAATHPVGRRTKQAKSLPITNAAHKKVVLTLVQRGGKVRGWSCKVAEIAAKLRCSKCNSREVNVYEPRR